jgi:hypothetical protein
MMVTTAQTNKDEIRLFQSFDSITFAVFFQFTVLLGFVDSN